jgi:hypothetical protein
MQVKAVRPFLELLADKYDAANDQIIFIFKADDGEPYSIKIPATLAPFLMIRTMTMAGERAVPQERPQVMYPLNVTGSTPMHAQDGSAILALRLQGNTALTLQISKEVIQQLEQVLAEMKSLADPGPQARH